MSIPDSFIMNYFKLLTDVPDKELKEINQALADDSVNPMEIKKCLAKDIIAQLYNDDAATEAESHFRQVVQNKEIPDDIYSAKSDSVIIMVISQKLVKSKGEAKRLVSQGAVEIDNVKVTDLNTIVPAGSVLRIGKRRYIKAI